MARVNKQVIKNAIEELKINNIEITTLNVHKLTGGSLTTVSKYIKEIKDDESNKTITPEFLRKKINAIADEMYNTINTSFSIKLNDLHQAQEQFEQEKIKINKEIESLTQDNLALKKQLEDLKVKQQTTQSLMQEQRLDFVAELSKKDTDIRALTNELDNLKSLIEIERADFKNILDSKNEEIQKLSKTIEEKSQTIKKLLSNKS